MDNTDHKAARRVNEQYHCHHCGKQWDHDDPEPPECVREPLVKVQLSNSYGCSTKHPCGECNNCATFCDTCGFWYADPNPCRYHNDPDEPGCINSDGEICGECNDCASYCDVCASWHDDDDPCEFH